MVANQGQHPWLCISVSLLALMPIVGCSSTQLGNITGMVSLNGEPLDDAIILFRPMGGEQARAAQTQIQNGSYKFDQIPVGEYSVWVMAERKTGRKTPVLDVKAGEKKTYDDEVVQIIPVNYNVRTELHASIEPGENQQDFDLTVQKRR